MVRTLYGNGNGHSISSQWCGQPGLSSCFIVAMRIGGVSKLTTSVKPVQQKLCTLLDKSCEPCASESWPQVDELTWPPG
jgi:hypothetical protein